MSLSLRQRFVSSTGNMEVYILFFKPIVIFCFSAMGNCGLYFRDRIETFDLTEAELNVENNKDQTENERVI